MEVQDVSSPETLGKSYHQKCEEWCGPTEAFIVLLRTLQEKDCINAIRYLHLRCGGKSAITFIVLVLGVLLPMLCG